MIATVIAGDYKGWTISEPIFGDLKLFKPFSLREHVVLNSDTVDSCKTVSSVSNTRGGGLGKALVGGAIFGVAGAVAGGHGKTITTTTFDVVMKSGKRFRIETNSAILSSKLNALGF